jgi:hypothetical protein
LISFGLNEVDTSITANNKKLRLSFKLVFIRLNNG